MEMRTNQIVFAQIKLGMMMELAPFAYPSVLLSVLGEDTRNLHNIWIKLDFDTSVHLRAQPYLKKCSALVFSVVGINPGSKLFP